METDYSNLVSVIIPIYNAEQYIEETIETVFSQTYDPIEIVLVDDCSRDNSAKVIEKYVDGNKVRYYKQPRNLGAAEARNRGIDAAYGRYIAFLDSDDLWDSDKVRKQVDFLKANNAAFVFTAYDMIDMRGIPIQEKIKIQTTVSYKDLMRKTMISTPTVMIDRIKLKDISFPLRRTGQDYALWLKLLRETDAYGIDEALVHVRRRPGSLSKNKFQNIRDIWEIQQAEGVSPVNRVINIILYCIYTVKKRFL